MQQTLLALLGLLIVTLLSFSQQQSDIRSQQQALQREYQQMALGVAKQSIEVVRARTFDQALDNGETDVSKFTKEADAAWGGKDCIDSNQQYRDACSAIEHFHDDETLTMENPDGLIDVQIPDHTVLFQVEFEVHYAEENGSRIVRASGSSPTRLKEVTVRVQDCQDENPSNNDPCDGKPLLSQPLVFSEVFSYSG